MDLISLFEMDWFDRTPITHVLKANRDRWIHFSSGAPNRDLRNVPLLPEPPKPTYYDRRKQKDWERAKRRIDRQNAIHRVPKLGINPKSIWLDPKGIYFYPVNWLLSGPQRMLDLQQHGLDAPFYYIVDVNLNDPNGVDLSKITWEQVENIARRNGWWAEMDAMRKLPEDEQKNMLFTYAKVTLPGSFLWHFIDRMQKDGKITWAKAFRGISFIRDPGLAIIHSKEPDQLLVLNPRLISNVEFGKNVPIDWQNQHTLPAWNYALVGIIKAIRGEFGGDLTWKDKQPSLTFQFGKGTFTLRYTSKRSSDEAGLTMDYTWGRAKGSLYFKTQQFRDMPRQTIIQTIVRQVRRIGAMKTDLLFKPVISIAEAEQVARRVMTNCPQMQFKADIHNDENGKFKGSIFLRGEDSRSIDNIVVNTGVHLGLYTDHISPTVTAKIGIADLIWVSTYEDELDYTDVAARAADNFRKMMDGYHPRRRGDSYRRHPLFDDEAEYTAAMGWIVKNCGINLDGHFLMHFADEIAAYETFKDKRVLINNIRYIFNSKH